MKNEREVKVLIEAMERMESVAVNNGDETMGVSLETAIEILKWVLGEPDGNEPA